MNRRTLLKLLGLIPFIGPSIASALVTTTAKARRLSGPYLPPYFPKWNAATDDLESGWNWTRDLERDRLPDGIVFPRAGQVWEAVCDCEVSFQASVGIRKNSVPTIGEMMTRFGQAILRKGERVRILEVDGPKPLQVDFIPVRYDELHGQIIPERTRKLPGYGGYALHLRSAKTYADFSSQKGQTYFVDSFRPVEA